MFVQLRILARCTGCIYLLYNIKLYSRPCIVVCSNLQLTGMAVLVPQFASFICLLVVGCTALTVNKFIPFGTDKGDTIFFSNDDNTTSIAVPVRFPFHDRLFTTIHVRQSNVTMGYVYNIISDSIFWFRIIIMFPLLRSTTMVYFPLKHQLVISHPEISPSRHKTVSEGLEWPSLLHSGQMWTQGMGTGQSSSEVPQILQL